MYVHACIGTHDVSHVLEDGFVLSKSLHTKPVSKVLQYCPVGEVVSRLVCPENHLHVHVHVQKYITVNITYVYVYVTESNTFGTYTCICIQGIQ